MTVVETGTKREKYLYINLCCPSHSSPLELGSRQRDQRENELGKSCGTINEFMTAVWRPSQVLRHRKIEEGQEKRLEMDAPVKLRCMGDHYVLFNDTGVKTGSKASASCFGWKPDVINISI